MIRHITLQATGPAVYRREMFYKLIILLSGSSTALLCSLHATLHLRYTHTPPVCKRARSSTPVIWWCCAFSDRSASSRRVTDTQVVRNPGGKVCLLAEPLAHKDKFDKTLKWIGFSFFDFFVHFYKNQVWHSLWKHAKVQWWKVNKYWGRVQFWGHYILLEDLQFMLFNSSSAVHFPRSLCYSRFWDTWILAVCNICPVHTFNLPLTFFVLVLFHSFTFSWHQALASGVHAMIELITAR